MKKMKKITAFIMALTILFTMNPLLSNAGTAYMPDVTEEMTKASYWSDKQPAPDEVLASQEEITRINKAILNESACNMYDLAAWSQETYDGVALNASLKKAAQADAEYCYDGLGAIYDQDGNKLETFEQALEVVYSPMIENCVDANATESMPTRYAICTSRTLLTTFPSDQSLLDAPNKSDADFDVQPLSAVLLGEPVIARGCSGDGKYWHVMSTDCQGWVPTADIAFCDSKEEWLSAWKFDADETLVVYDDKVYTEESNSFPQASKKLLSMGTCLRLVDPSEWETRITNRSAYNNHVVWLPVRAEDGSLEMLQALVSQHHKVSEGYLPVTASNISKVLFSSLGSAYGWGGMLSSQDCSGYVKEVYCCFGLKLARNTTWQAAMPVKKYTFDPLADITDATEKEEARRNLVALIKSLPLGSTLIFRGHTMMYLGNIGDKLYVISSVSSMKVNDATTRVRATVINTLDITRPNGNSWLESLHTITIPFLEASATDIPGSTPQDLTMTLDKTAYVYDGNMVTPEVTVQSGGRTIDPDDYDLSWSSGRKNVGSYTVTATLKNRWKGSVSASFRIYPKGTSIKKLVRKKQKVTIKWQKQAERMASSRINGYQLQYATNSAFTRGMEQCNIKKYNINSKTLSQLRKKTKYYFRIRCCLTKDGTSYYSPWSKVKSVKTK